MSDRIHPYWGTRWAEKLRTTPARQITGELHDGYGGMCALGVLFEEMIQDGLIAPWDQLVWVGSPEAEQQDALVASLVPQQIRAEVIYMNDTRGLSFAEIANYIEWLIACDTDPEAVDRASRDAYPELLEEQDGVLNRMLAGVL